MASVIFTGRLVPKNKKHLKLFSYSPLNFSLTLIRSWDTRLFRRVLSSIRLKSPSCSMATSGFFLKGSSANALLLWPSALESKVAVYPANSCSIMPITVDLPVPAAP